MQSISHALLIAERDNLNRAIEALGGTKGKRPRHRVDDVLTSSRVFVYLEIPLAYQTQGVRIEQVL